MICLFKGIYFYLTTVMPTTPGECLSNVFILFGNVKSEIFGIRNRGAFIAFFTTKGSCI